MECVIVDIETTGLDIENVSIIEVGAVVFDGSSIKSRYSSFVSYAGEIPETVKRKTGITEKMLVGAPPVEKVVADLRSFINKRPVVSHNGYGFDFPILERAGLKIQDKHDSMELAFFVMPTHANGHSMSALAEHFGLPEIEHRALRDCEAECAVIKNLAAEYEKRPKKIREALNYLAQQTNWWWGSFLPGKSFPFNLISDLVPYYEPYRKEPSKQEVIPFKAQPIDLAEVEKQFASSGSRERGDYSEDRPEQRSMAVLVADSFNTKRHAVIEAGTGTGKSKAYLVPSIFFAQKNKIPMIISTHTKVLQDQLFAKEIKHIKDTAHNDLHATVLKGKTNYVCLQKFDEFVDAISQQLSQRSLYEDTSEGLRFSTRLACLLLSSWVLATERGDWDEVTYWLKEKLPKQVEQEICNKDELCGPDMCELHDAKKCFLAKAKLRARDADLVIINHAIALMGITVQEAGEPGPERPSEETSKPVYGHTVFPGEAKFIVFDEAHHLEEDATSAWTHEITDGGMQFLMQQLFGKKGALQTVKSIAERNRSEHLIQWAGSYERAAGEIKLLAETLFSRILPPLVPPQADEQGSVFRMLDDIEDGAFEKKAFLETSKVLATRLSGAKKALDLIADAADSPRTRKILHARIRAIGRVLQALDAILGKDAQFVRYVERLRSNISVKAAPLSVAPYLKNYVYDNFDSVVLTSATITVDRGFGFFAKRCGTSLVPAEKIRYQSFQSSFDYAKQCQFFVPKGITYSGKPEIHLEQSMAFLERAIIESGGGALVLCSSHAQVEALYERLARPLSQHNLWLLRQPKDSSPSSVIRDFKRDMDSVLIGTKTLWQGVDIPGDSLRALFIFKIPYDRPDDPLVKARRAEIDTQGGHSFAEYYEPLAAIAIKQGFGRLIRKATDAGIAILLDENLMQKKRILGSLPEGVVPHSADPDLIFAALKKLSDRVHSRAESTGA